MIKPKALFPQKKTLSFFFCEPAFLSFEINPLHLQGSPKKITLIDFYTIKLNIRKANKLS